MKIALLVGLTRSPAIGCGGPSPSSTSPMETKPHLLPVTTGYSDDRCKSRVSGVAPVCGLDQSKVRLSEVSTNRYL